MDARHAFAARGVDLAKLDELELDADGPLVLPEGVDVWALRPHERVAPVTSSRLRAGAFVLLAGLCLALGAGWVALGHALAEAPFELVVVGAIGALAFVCLVASALGGGS